MHAPRTMRLLFVVAILVTAAPSIGRFEIGAQTNREPNFQERYPRYRLRPGDVLELNFLFSPEFNQNVVIQPDCYVNLRGVEDLGVKEKDVDEVVEIVAVAFG